MFEVTKVCFKCGVEKPLSAFYKHPQMADGHLNKCKECTRKDSKANYNIKSQDEEWVEKERVRGKEKFKRLGYKGRFKSPREICRINGEIAAYARRRGIDTKGFELHHWNYNEPFCIFKLSRKAHRRLHKHIVVNYDDGFTYTLDGRKIESEDMAKSLYAEYLKMEGIYDDLEYYDLSKMNTTDNK